MTLNIFKERRDEIEGELAKNANTQEEITQKQAELVRAQEEAVNKEVELEGEKITTELAAEDFEREQTEKQAKIAQLKSDLETKITELEALGLNVEPLKKDLKNLTEKSENIEGGISFEWGPELGKMKWDEAQKKIESFNKTLKEGEKPWRLPTKEELLEVIKPFTEFKKKGATQKELDKILKEIRQKHNLRPVGYWSSTTHADNSDSAWFVGMYYGNVYYDNKGSDDILVRCVR